MRNSALTLRSALKAIDAQMDCDEKMSPRGDGTPELCRRQEERI